MNLFDEDALQEARLAWLLAGHEEPPPSGWLFRVAKNFRADMCKEDIREKAAWGDEAALRALAEARAMHAEEMRSHRERVPRTDCVGQYPRVKAWREANPEKYAEQRRRQRERAKARKLRSV